MISVQCSVFSARKDGQAITELMVGLVAIVVLLAGLVQIATIAKRHTDAMVKARKDAGRLAMQSGRPASAAAYLEDWDVAADGKRYTRDDDPIDGDPGDFNSYIVDKAAQNAVGWDILDSAQHDDIPRLRNSAIPATQFGLVEGHAEDTVELFPVFRHLIYAADAINIECRVWQTWTTGIY